MRILSRRDVLALLGLRECTATDLRAAIRASEVCVTWTPARRWFVSRAEVVPDTFITAVRADSQGKQGKVFGDTGGPASIFVHADRRFR